MMKSMTLGRSASCNLQVPSSFDTVSANHATVERQDNGEYLLTDHSTNGSYVNGTHIHNASTIIRRGDSISLSRAYVLNFDDVVRQLGETISKDTPIPGVSQEGTPRVPRPNCVNPVRPVASSTPQPAPKEINPAPETPIKPKEPKPACPDRHMGLAVVSLVLGISNIICIILSVIAIINASNVNTLWLSEQYAAAREASEKSYKYGWISIVVGVVCFILSVIVLVNA